MNRWEAIAEQFGKIEGVGLMAILRNDEVAKWDVIGDSKSNGKKFLDIVDEASSELGRDDRNAWFNHLWKTYQDRFEVSGQPLPGTEYPGGEEVWFCNKTIEDAAGLSARAARDLAEIEPKQELITVVEDDSAYVSMADVWPNRFTNATQCSRFLNKHPEIQTRNPTTNRRIVHLADWHNYWKKHDREESEKLDSAEIQEFLTGKEQQEATERKRKNEKK